MNLKLNNYIRIFIVMMIFGIFSTYSSKSITITSEYSENVLLSTSNSPYPHHVEPTFAISDNGTLFAGWKNAYGPSSGGVRVSFSKSTDNGQSWSKSFDMPLFNPEIQTGQSDPWMVWFDGVLYYAYIEFGLPAPFDNLSLSQVTLAQSSDYGNSWSLSRASNNTNFADKETMTIKSDGTIIIAYGDVPLDTSNVMRLSISKDGGQTFNDSLIISDANDGTFDQIAPYVTTNSNDEIFVSWLKLTSESYRGYLVLDKLNEDGFGIDQRITDGDYSVMTRASDGSGSKWTLPSIRFDSKDRLYLLWSDISELNSSWDIYLKYSDDFGVSWSEKIQVNPNTNGNQWMADMDIDINDNLHIVYFNEQNNNYRPYYQVISIINDEIDISEAIPVAREDTSSSFTRPGDYLTVRTDSNSITHVVWSDGRNNDMDIYYAQCDCLKIVESDISSTSDTQQAGFESFSVIVVIFLIAIRKNNNRKK